MEDRWVPLVPVGDDAALERAFQDEDGNLRAAHRLVCTSPGGAAIRATRLPRPVMPSALAGAWSQPDADGVIEPIAQQPFTIKRKRKRKGESSPIGGDDIPFDP